MRIVVGYIGTAQGYAALDAAISESRLRGGTVHVVSSLRGDEESKRFVAQRDALDQARSLLDEAGVPYEIHDYARDQSVAQDLIQTVDELGAELLVIGMRKRSPVGKLVMGSNAVEILMNAPCPVLAVRPQGDDS